MQMVALQPKAICLAGETYSWTDQFTATSVDGRAYAIQHRTWHFQDNTFQSCNRNTLQKHDTETELTETEFTKKLQNECSGFNETNTNMTWRKHRKENIDLGSGDQFQRKLTSRWQSTSLLNFSGQSQFYTFALYIQSGKHHTERPLFS